MEFHRKKIKNCRKISTHAKNFKGINLFLINSLKFYYLINFH